MLALVFYQTGMYGEFACGYLVLKGIMIMNCRGVTYILVVLNYTRYFYNCFYQGYNATSSSGVSLSKPLQLKSVCFAFLLNWARNFKGGKNPALVHYDSITGTIFPNACWSLIYYSTPVFKLLLFRLGFKFSQSSWISGLWHVPTFKTGATTLEFVILLLFFLMCDNLFSSSTVFFFSTVDSLLTHLPLYKKVTSVKRTPRPNTCLYLLPALFDYL